MRVSALAALTLMALATQDWNRQATAHSASDSQESLPDAGQPDSQRTIIIATATVNASPPELIPTLEASTTLEPLAFEVEAGRLQIPDSSLPIASLEGVANLPTRLGPEAVSIPEFFHELEPGYRSPKKPAKQEKEISSPTSKPLPIAVPVMVIQPTMAVPASQPPPSVAVPIPVIPPKPTRTRPSPRRIVQPLSPLQIQPGSPRIKPTFAPFLQPASFPVAQRPTQGISRRRMRLQTSIIATVTNHTSRAIEIELVGQTRPLVLLPGHTWTLQGGPRDFSLLYWVPDRPNRPAQALAAQVTQIGPRQLLVDIFSSRFPNDNQAIYYPEPGRADVLKIF